MRKALIEKQGTTLVEISLYFAIVGIVLLAAMTFSIQILRVTHQAKNMHELQSNIDLISHKITQTIQEAESIDNAGSVFENDQGTLSLNVLEPAQSPTKFYYSDEAVYIKKGAAAATKISSEGIKCTQLRFEKIQYDKTPDQIIVDAQFEPLYTDIPNLDHTMSFHTSISLRKL